MATSTSTTASTVPSLDTGRKNKVAGESLSTVAVRRLRKDTLTLVAIGFLLFITLLSALASPISNALNVSYNRTNTDNTFAPPSFQPYEGEDGNQFHILGTDDLGRDHLSRLLYGGQVSLSVGFFAGILSLTIGVSLGVITGYYTGLVDDFVNWIISTLSSIPSLFLLIIIAAVLPKSPATLVLVLGFIGWTSTTRLVRGETLSLREREFIVSARAIGASPVRIMFIHIMPNLFSIIIITLAIDIGALILIEAALSFLGLGIQEPFPSWGNMLSNAQEYFTLGPFLVIWPGLMIFLTVLCLYIVGDGFRDAFDPQSKE